MSEFLLTVVTVTKDCSATIRRTLESVAAIKSAGVEYVVVDGVSTDGTLDVIDGYRHIVDRLVSEPDSGIYNAMNKGVALARGQYVLFINGDDELVSEGFPAVISVLTEGKNPIVCGTTIVGQPDSPAETLVANPRRLPFFNAIPHPSSFVHRELLLRWPFREDLRIVSDYDFFLRAHIEGQPFRVVPAVTAIHQRGGASSDSARSQAELEQVRRQRLGWRYGPFNAVAMLHRLVKRIAPASVPR
jgi:glycosyltransferase involved in cell wall biosynthesis